MKVSSCHLPDLRSEYFLINFPSKMIFNTKLKIQRRSINMYNQTSLIQTPKGQNQVSTLQRCLYFGERECMIFGFSGTKQTVRDRKVRG